MSWEKVRILEASLLFSSLFSLEVNRAKGMTYWQRYQP
jgi:hypothetical protein